MRNFNFLKTIFALALAFVGATSASAYDIVDGQAYRIVSEMYPEGTVQSDIYGSSGNVIYSVNDFKDDYSVYWVFSSNGKGQYYITDYYGEYVTWTSSGSGNRRSGKLTLGYTKGDQCLWTLNEVEKGVFEIVSAYQQATTANATHWMQTNTYSMGTYAVSLGTSSSSGTKFFLVDQDGYASNEESIAVELPTFPTLDADKCPNAAALDGLVNDALKAYYARCGSESLINDPSQLWCGFGQNDLGTAIDGEDISVIIDGNPATYFHTYWQGARVPQASHYFYVMAEEGSNAPFQGELKVDLTRRTAVNDHLTQFLVYGTNDKPDWGMGEEYGTAYPFTDANWEPIAYLDLPNPVSGAVINTKLSIPGGKSYSALKFACTGQASTTKGKYFFHLAEFQLSDYVITPDCDNAVHRTEAEALLKAINDARTAIDKAVESGKDCSSTLYNTLNAALNTYKELFKGESTDLVINEYQVANVDQTIDPSYNYGSWIELYNAGSTSVDLSGYTLTHTDSDGIVESYTFNYGGVGNVPAHGYKVIWFDHNSADGFFGKYADNQVRFKLDCEGGMLDLADSDGELIATLLYDTAIPRCSYARTTDGGKEWRWTANPTPGSSNAKSTFADVRLDAPVVSTDGGIIDGNVSFSVTIPAGTQLIYTVDGSTPALGSGMTQVSKDGKFNFFETTVFRCCLVADGYLPSPVVTRSFIERKQDYYLPVISIVTDPRHLYDDEIGVYCVGTNGRPGNATASDTRSKNWNMDWERPVNVEYLVPQADASGNGATTYATAFNMGSDFEICGGWSRGYGGGSTIDRTWEMRSSFRLKTDKRYEGQNSFDYPIFPNNPYRKYKSLQIRNGGNDTSIRTTDAATQLPLITSGLYIDAQDVQPAHIFFNGEFLGTFNIRESNNKAYGYSGYGIGSDDIDAFEIHSEKPNYEQKAGDREALDRWIELAEQLAENADWSTGFAESNPENDAIWAEILKLVDITEYANYFATALNLGLGDWLNNPNNCKGFRDRRDGKFHFTLFDVDSATSSSLFSTMMNGGCKTEISDLFRNMIKYHPFQRQFLDTWAVINGSVLSEDNVRTAINNFTSLNGKAMTFEYQSSTATKSTGNSVINNYLNYKSKRISSLTDYYRYSDNISTVNLSVSSNIPDARLLLNNVEMPLNTFEGQAYTPATITALAPAGYTFEGWQLAEGSDIGGGSANETLTDIIPFKSKWQYYDKGSADEMGWKDDSFKEKWDVGTAPFGFGNFADIDTRFDNINKLPTYYFRQTFKLDKMPAASDSYRLIYKVDDGCVAYVNGHAVGSHNMASDEPKYDELATRYDSNAPYQETVKIPAEYLRVGENVIAVEVHNVALTSSDIYFDGSIVLAQPSGGGEKPAVEGIVSRNQNLDLSELPSNYSGYHLTALYTRLEEVKVAPVRVNEVSANNGVYVDHDNWKRNDWVELYNTTNQPIDVAGMYLSDKAGNPQKWAIPAKGTNGSNAETVIAPHSTLIIWCDKLMGSKELHATFKLGNTDGSVVTLQAADGSWTDTFYYDADPSNGTASYGRYPDGSDNIYYMERATIDSRNSMTYGVLDLDALAYDYPMEGEATNDEFNLRLTTGWNWISHPFAEAQPVSIFTKNATAIRGEKAEYVLDGATWNGSLTTLEPAYGYKAQYDMGTTLRLTGTYYDTAAPVKVNAGWNWIGCPLASATDINVALADLKATEGDAIVGLEGFSTYSDGNWIGTLTTMTPGQGYLLSISAAQQFTWSAPAKSAARRGSAYGAKTASDLGSVDVHAYPNVMSLIGTLDESALNAAGIGLSNFDGFSLAAFVKDANNECRGVSSVIDGRFYLNIHGDKAEHLNFVLLDASGQEYSVNESLDFNAQSIVGSHKAPYAFTFSGITEVINEITCSGDVVEVAIYTPAGQRIERLQRGVNIVTTRYANGRTTVQKVTSTK